MACRVAVKACRVVVKTNCAAIGYAHSHCPFGCALGRVSFWLLPISEFSPTFVAQLALVAQVAELVDALVSNTSGSDTVPVRSRSWAQAVRCASPFFVSERFLIRNISSSKLDKQEALDRRYLAMARIWATNSYCVRRQVGALLVKDKMIISDGYNGTPSGFPNVCENPAGETYPYVLHAEANAITKVARSSNSSLGATLYVTASPCMECAKLIIQAGIVRVVYGEQYRLRDGLDLLERAGIETVYIAQEK